MTTMLRQELMSRRLQDWRDAMATITREIGGYRPLGRVSEVAMVIGAKPSRGVAIDTPIGLMVFAKNRQPAQETLDRWRELYKTGQEALEQNIEIGSFDIIGSGLTIGNKLYLLRGQRLRSQKLLDEAELGFLGVLERFWKEYPRAKSGTVQTDGSIAPWYSSGGTRGA